MTENNSVVFYDIVKLCKGGLVLTLPSFDSTGLDRRVDFDYNVDKIRVPRSYALGIFTDGTLERMYKEGYFKVEPAEQFEKEASEIFYPIEKDIVIISDSDIISNLKSGNRVKIKEIINSSEVNRDKVIILARANIAEIPTSMVRDLEKILGVELEVENEAE